MRILKTINLVFFESPIFTRLLPDYLDDQNYQALQLALLENPNLGDRIPPGTGGFRKIRWQDSRRSKGKRGGLRIIYYYLGTDNQIWFFTIYYKDEVSDLTMQEKRILKQAIQAELAAMRQSNE